jgi:electron transfer flavoprotein alpha subunit
MSGILVLCDHADGAFTAAANELLTLASSMGPTVSAAVLGDAPAATLGGLGASQVFQAAGSFDAANGAAIVDALEAIVAASGASVLLGPGTFVSHDALPRLAARLGAGMATDCSKVELVDGKLVGTREWFAGRAQGHVTVQSELAIATVVANSGPKSAPSDATAPVVSVEWSAKTPGLELVETLAPQTDGVDLNTADIVIAGGRSLKSKENFDSVIRTLAGSLRAGVGASRAATDAGMALHSEQIGQTGVTVSPSLYIAAGISGAIQHLAGMRTSNVIVAINTDAGAPIFEHATYGIVGDLFEICPAIAEAVAALD